MCLLPYLILKYKMFFVLGEWNKLNWFDSPVKAHLSPCPPGTPACCWSYQYVLCCKEHTKKHICATLTKCFPCMCLYIRLKADKIYHAIPYEVSHYKTTVCFYFTLFLLCCDCSAILSVSCCIAAHLSFTVTTWANTSYFNWLQLRWCCQWFQGFRSNTDSVT